MRPEVWEQIKNITASRLMHALERDGWIQRRSRGSAIVYKRPDKPIISIHYHPNKTYGIKQLKELIITIGWSEEDLRRLKLIK